MTSKCDLKEHSNCRQICCVFYPYFASYTSVWFGYRRSIISLWRCNIIPYLILRFWGVSRVKFLKNRWPQSLSLKPASISIRMVVACVPPFVFMRLAINASHGYYRLNGWLLQILLIVPPRSFWLPERGMINFMSNPYISSILLSFRVLLWWSRNTVFVSLTSPHGAPVFRIFTF